MAGGILWTICCGFFFLLRLDTMMLTKSRGFPVSDKFHASRRTPCHKKLNRNLFNILVIFLYVDYLMLFCRAKLKSLFPSFFAKMRGVFSGQFSLRVSHALSATSALKFTTLKHLKKFKEPENIRFRLQTLSIKQNNDNRNGSAICAMNRD